MQYQIRYPTQFAIQTLAKRFNLPNTPTMQDWEYISDVSWESNIYAMDYEFEALMNKSLSELSDSPRLLKEFIEQTPDIRYDAEQDRIVGIALDSIKFIQLKALNAFLKQPIFEVRQISLEALAELE